MQTGGMIPVVIKVEFSEEVEKPAVDGA